MSEMAAIEIDRLRRQVAELLPYALAGAEALDFREPYGPTDEAVREALCDAAGAMIVRIKSGEFWGVTS